MSNAPFRFPKSANKAGPSLILLSVVAPAYMVAVVWYCFSPKTTEVGYAPLQPVPFSHELHAGQLGMDCMHCHNTADTTARASIPSTQMCMTCHQTIGTENPKLDLVRESFETGKPIEWKRVHDLPDYTYFDHSAHINAGVGCASCHGRVDKMEVVRQVETLSMGWCLDCHRDPDAHIRPPDAITDMEWHPPISDEDSLDFLALKRTPTPSQDCSTCHR